MRILLLCHEYPPIGGGAGAAAAALARQYARQQHGVTVVTMAYGPQPARETVDGCDVVRIPCRRRRREMASPLEGLRWANIAWRTVLALHAQHPFDVTHAHFIMPAGIVARRLKRSKRVPFVITAHGSDVPGYNRERLKLVHHVVRPWWRRICRDCDRLVCPSQSIRELIRSAGGDDHGVVIPYGFEPGRFTPLPKEKRILMCSRLVERKGFQYVLKALSELKLSGWEVDVVGDGPMFDQLATMAKRCTISVRMHGWIDNTDQRLSEMYGKAAIFALPSEWENFPVALLEAMSAGCAIITCDIAGNPEVVGDTGCLVQPQDVDGLRSAIQSLSADVNSCTEMGKRACKRLHDNFLLNEIADRHLNLLESLIGTKELC